eukprot:jgi/Chrzof1/880/Cz01g32150.t1
MWALVVIILAGLLVAFKMPVPVLLSYVKFAVDIKLRKLFKSSDGREERLLTHVLKTAKKNDPQSVLDAIDSYAHSREFFMNVGDSKGHILTQELAKQPQPVMTVLVGACKNTHLFPELHQLSVGTLTQQ